MIIVGAGLAGLSAGYYARMNGYRAQIFEHHSKPGGVAASWDRQGYAIDGGIHFLMGCRSGQPIFELYRELGVVESEADIIPMSTYGRALDQRDGRAVVATRDLGRLVDDLASVSPRDRGSLEKLIGAARALQGLDMASAGLERPPELMSGREKLKQMWGLRGAGRYFSGQWVRPVSEFTKDLHDPWVRWVIDNLFLPEVPVWFVAALLGLLADGQLGMPARGSRGIVAGMQSRYLERDGEVTFGATVEEILTDHGRAVGVRLADGSIHRSDAVISAADGRSTIFTLLRGRFLDRRVAERYEKWALFRPMVLIHLGVARDFPDDPPLTMVRLDKPIDIGSESIQGMFIRLFNYAPGFAPVGRSLVQVELETDWDHWNLLHAEPHAYQAEKDRVLAEVLVRLEAVYPGVSSQVDMTDVATPYTTWRYTLNHRGAYEAFLPTPETITTAVDRTLPGLQGFFMAGQWVMPGGGVPPALFSGRHAVELLCHWDGRPFVRSRTE